MKNQELKYNVYFEIEPLYYVSRLLGLAPFSLRKKKSGETEVHFSQSDFILTTTLSVVLLVGLCLNQFVVANTSYINVPTFFYVLGFIETLATYSTCIVTLILNISIYRKHLPLILRRIYVLDSKFLNDGRNEERYKSRRSGTTKQLTVIGIIWIINFLSCIYYFFIGGIFITLIVSSRILCNTIFFLISCQYTSMVLVLKARYNHLTSILSKLLITNRNLYETDLTRISTSGHSGAGFVLYSNTRCVHVSKILELQHIYCQLYDVLWLVNKCYGIPLLLLITATIFNFVNSFFMSIVFIKNVILGEREFIKYMLLSTNLCWCFTVLFMFVWIISCCHLVTEEVHKLLLCIHKIQIYSNVTQSAISELRSFVSQLKDMRVEFSVCGLFTLNLPYLFGTLSVITTYVVVLFQLQ
jgi:hypothetical protein